MQFKLQASKYLLGILTLSVLGICRAQHAGLPDLDELTDGWNTVAGDEGTVCADGSSYKFFVRPGSLDKLLIHFAGGGACSNGMTCDADLDPTPYVRNLENIDPAVRGGIFDFDNPENPFQDYSVVFAPYCTGDVHLGDRVRVYRSPTVEDHAGHDVTIHHKGMVNAEYALNWVYRQFSALEAVFVAGSSAGAIPSPYFAMLVAEQYPDAAIGHLADAAGGYRTDENSASPESASVDEWGAFARLRRLPEFAELEPGNLNIVRLYEVAAGRFPNVTFAAFDNAEDRVQKAFTGLLLDGDEDVSLLPAIMENQKEIHDAVINFRSFIAGGETHTILTLPSFYTLHVDGVRVRDWVSQLAQFGIVPNVRCSVCDVAQLLPVE